MADAFYEQKTLQYFGTIRRDVMHCFPEKLGDVLDVGGGNGATSLWLTESDRASSAVVVDPFCTTKSTERVTFLQEDANDAHVFKTLALEGRTFETILCLDVLEHLYDPWQVLKELKPLLAENGNLIVSLPNMRFVGLVLPLVLWGQFRYKKSGIMDKTHIRWFTRKTARSLVEDTGFRICKMEAKIEPRVKLINLLTLGLFRGFFEYQYFIVATKH